MFDSLDPIAKYASVVFFAVACLAAATNHILKLVDWFRAKPSTVELRSELEKEFVRRSEFTKLEQSVQKLSEKIGAGEREILEKLDEMKGDLNAAGERRAAGIFEQLKEDRDRVARLHAEITRLDERSRHSH